MGDDSWPVVKRELFHYELPQERIAAIPLEQRDAARMLVCSRTDPEIVKHRHVRDLGQFLQSGDAMVVNDTRVRPWRLVGQRATGARVECLVLEHDGCAARTLLRPAKKLRAGEVVAMEGGAVLLTFVGRGEGGHSEVELRAADGDLDQVLELVGRAPLPPYVKRADDDERNAADRERYQTVFAAKPGAVAAPTAGLHLTDALLDDLRGRQVDVVSVTLHVGEGTFASLEAETIEAHVMHPERYELAPDAADRLNAASRVFCVGTTSTRVVESCLDPVTEELAAGTGETSLYLHPGNEPRFVDGLLTNFHLPESTLLLLVCSILGRERTLALYDLAIHEGYRFFSYGDAMLILP